MIALAWDLLPLLLGVVASPLALMALIAVLLSERARSNGALFALGWSMAILIVSTLAFLVWGEVDLGAEKDPAGWVGVLRLLFGFVFAAAAVWTYRRAQVSLHAMATASTPEEVAAAAPQLPGMLKSVEHFTPIRSFLLGLGIFLLNPINVSCAIIAVLDIKEAGLEPPAPLVFIGIFIALGVLPMVVPAVLVHVRREGAAATLERLRTWIAKHNGMISVVFLGMIAFAQLQKALQIWI